MEIEIEGIVDLSDSRITSGLIGRHPEWFRNLIGATIAKSTTPNPLKFGDIMFMRIAYSDTRHNWLYEIMIENGFQKELYNLMSHIVANQYHDLVNDDMYTCAAEIILLSFLPEHQTQEFKWFLWSFFSSLSETTAERKRQVLLTAINYNLRITDPQRRYLAWEHQFKFWKQLQAETVINDLKKTKDICEAEICGESCHSGNLKLVADIFETYNPMGFYPVKKGDYDHQRSVMHEFVLSDIGAPIELLEFILQKFPKFLPKKKMFDRKTTSLWTEALDWCNGNGDTPNPFTIKLMNEIKEK